MKACVFVDSENFRYSITNLFSPDFFNKNEYLPKNARWAEFFDYIVCQSSSIQHTRLRTYWYTVATVDSRPYLPHPENIAEINKLLNQNEKYIKQDEYLCELPRSKVIPMLRWRKQYIEKRFSDFQTTQEKISKEHNAIEFRRSGEISYNLFDQKLGKEKTVDVNLAVDMLQMRDIYDMAIIVSGDQDYLPAVQAVKNAGKTVINVAFAAKSGTILPGGAKRLNETTDRSITVDYKTFADYMNLKI